MKNKKLIMFFTIVVWILSNVNIVFADSNTVEIAKLTTKITQMANVMGGIIVAMATVMIIYGGFKYVTSDGNYADMEKAKSIIIHAGIGIFIASIAMVIVQVFGVASTSTEKAKATPIVQQHQVHKQIAPKHEIKDTTTIEELSTKKDKSNGIAEVIFIIIVGMVFSVLLTKIIQSSNFKTKEKETNTEELPKIDLKKRPREKQPKGKTTIYDDLLQLKNELEKREIEKEIKEKVFSIMHSMEDVKKEIERFDIEARHLIEESIKNDIENMVNHYQELNTEDKTYYKEKVLNSLEKINEKVNIMQTNIENQKKHEIEKALMVVDEKYI